MSNNDDSASKPSIRVFGRDLASHEPDEPGGIRRVKVFTQDGKEASQAMDDVCLRGGSLLYPCEQFSKYLCLHGDSDGFVPAGEWLHEDLVAAYKLSPDTLIRMCFP